MANAIDPERGTGGKAALAGRTQENAALAASKVRRGIMRLTIQVASALQIWARWEVAQGREGVAMCIGNP